MIKIKKHEKMNEKVIIISDSIKTLTNFAFYLINKGYPNNIKQFKGNEFLIEYMELEIIETFLEHYNIVTRQIIETENLLKRLKSEIGE